jgi:hypothetical protein
MKAISLWQPWASLWCSERKVHETRHWPTSHRGCLLVHAAKRFEKNFGPDDSLRAILDDEYGGHWGMDLPTGALIGMVNLIDCRRTEDVTPAPDDYECGDFAPGRFAWQRREFKLFNFFSLQGLAHQPRPLTAICTGMRAAKKLYSLWASSIE